MESVRKGFCFTSEEREMDKKDNIAFLTLKSIHWKLSSSLLGFSPLVHYKKHTNHSHTMKIEENERYKEEKTGGKSRKSM